MEYVEYKDMKIFYIIKRRGTKNLNARINEDGVVVLSVPLLISKKHIEKFVIDSYFKLIKRKNKKKQNIINDGKIKILGVEESIETIDNIEYVLIKGLKEYLKEEYMNICQLMDIDIPPRVVLKKVKGYLGQYNKKKHLITLNILIGHLDRDCIKYVIIHELTHIRHMNHQKGFWCEVAKYLPQYKVLRNKCKKEFIYYENY